MESAQSHNSHSTLKTSTSSMIYKAVKFIWCMLSHFIPFLPTLKETQPEPITPIQTPPPNTLTNNPSLHNNLLSSQPCSNCNHFIQGCPNLNNVVYTSRWEETKQPDRVTPSFHDVTHSFSSTSANQEIKTSFVIGPGKISYTSVREKEAKKSSVLNQGDSLGKIPSISATATQDNGPGEKEIEAKSSEEKVVVVIKKAVVVDEGRWIKHYSSCHRILLVGEGDFSFSACLATAFGCASNMIATSLNSKEFLKKNYSKAMSNIQKLKSRKCKVLHNINATKMAQHKMLGHITFDRIVFNFPFAGIFKDLPRDTQLRRHRRLVSMFLKNAKGMISENGEVHISHKTNKFQMEWNVESIASSHGLRLIEAVEFDLAEYPGYHTKRGFGGDDNFDCNPSKTYKFGLKRVCP